MLGGRWSGAKEAWGKLHDYQKNETKTDGRDFRCKQIMMILHKVASEQGVRPRHKKEPKHNFMKFDILLLVTVFKSVLVDFGLKETLLFESYVLQWKNHTKIIQKTMKNIQKQTTRQEVGPLQDKPAEFGYRFFLLTDCRVLQNHMFHNEKTT